MRNIRLNICYDGTRYKGWQRLPGAENTIQGKIETTLSRILNETIEISGSGRTDAGVHAYCFCATVQKHGEASLQTNIPCEKIPFALNFRLPEDISVYYAKWVDDDFHARYSVQSKTYEYHILNSPFKNPFYVNRSYHFPKILTDSDIKRMQAAADNLCGKYDFSSFMSSGSNVKDTVRNVYECRVAKINDEIIIKITADGFLYNMVRIISGTLLEVGKGNITPEQIISIIESKDRSMAGSTLPAHGLYLTDVKY